MNLKYKYLHSIYIQTKAYHYIINIKKKSRYDVYLTNMYLWSVV